MLKPGPEKSTIPIPECAPPALPSEQPAAGRVDAPPAWQDSSNELAAGVEVTVFTDAIPDEIHDLLNLRQPGQMYVILDAKGRRMVMPRFTPEDAIEQITRALVGRNATPQQKQLAWERLRDQSGYRVERVPGDGRRSGIGLYHLPLGDESTPER